MESMQIAIAPFSRATISLGGGSFGTASIPISGMHNCQILAWTPTQIGIETGTTPNNAHFNFYIDWQLDGLLEESELLSGSIVLDCPTGVMWIKSPSISGLRYCGPNTSNGVHLVIPLFGEVAPTVG
jgi:hypothetical protein